MFEADTAYSSDCLDEAKRRVYSDPESNRSWNLCWLVLEKVRSDNLIPYYAGYQATLPSMWGGKNPTSEGTQQLASAFAVVRKPCRVSKFEANALQGMDLGDRADAPPLGRASM